MHVRGGEALRRANRGVGEAQGISADLIATLEGYTRAELDEVALRSQRNAAAAIEAGRFDAALVPVRDPVTGEVLLERDEHPRPGTTMEALAALPPSFTTLGETRAGPNGETLDEIALAAYPQARAIHHLHTAGNSSGIVDGAAAVAIASEEYVRAHGIRPRARIRTCSTTGTEPLLMLTGPAPVSRKALALAGMAVDDIDLWEINEAFAAVVLQTMRALDLDPARVNVNGGAIALGHPLGAPARCWSAPRSTSSSAPAGPPRSSPCASAAARGSRRSSSGFERGHRALPAERPHPCDTPGHRLAWRVVGGDAANPAPYMAVG